MTLNNVTKMRPVFTVLFNVELVTGAAIVLLGHMNKSENAKMMHHGLGLADIYAAILSILLVYRAL